MAGRAAENLIFNHFSTGAADDLARATDIAKEMITRYGMDEKLGPVTYDKEVSHSLGPRLMKQNLFSEDTGREIDLALKETLQNSMKKAVEILSKNKETLESSAKLLLEKETLDQDEFKKIFSKIV